MPRDVFPQCKLRTYHVVITQVQFLGLVPDAPVVMQRPVLMDETVTFIAKVVDIPVVMRSSGGFYCGVYAVSAIKSQGHCGSCREFSPN